MSHLPADAILRDQSRSNARIAAHNARIAATNAGSGALPQVRDFYIPARPSRILFPQPALSQRLAMRWLTASGRAPKGDASPRPVALNSMPNEQNRVRERFLGAEGYYGAAQRLPSNVRWVEEGDAYPARPFWPAVGRDPMRESRERFLYEVANPGTAPAGTMPIVPNANLFPPNTVFWRDEVARHGVRRPWSPQPAPVTRFTRPRTAAAEFAGGGADDVSSSYTLAGLNGLSGGLGATTAALSSATKAATVILLGSVAAILLARIVAAKATREERRA